MTTLPAQLDLYRHTRPGTNRQRRLPNPLGTKARVLVALCRNRQQGICILDLPPELGYCARNRISDLRKMGVKIRSETCHVHNHRAGVVRYWLEP